MKVAVTGGTGFVGSHTVSELIKNGHEVRVLARDPKRVAPALTPFGVDGKVETVTGDVADPASVGSFLTGCDAVVNAAAVYSNRASRTGLVKDTNVLGAENVIGEAHRLGLDPIVHVSSIAAFYGKPRGRTVGHESETGDPRLAYSRSKAESDRVARRYQGQGAPVVITYPGMVWGPNDPYFGETCIIARNIMRQMLTFVPGGVMACTDVRDVARVHAAAMKKGQGPRRYITPATNLPFRDIHGVVAEVTGRKIPAVALPNLLFTPALTLLFQVEKLLRFHSAWNRQGAYAIASSVTADDSQTRKELGIEPMPFSDSVRDTVRWMAEAGHISKRLAGKALS